MVDYFQKKYGCSTLSHQFALHMGTKFTTASAASMTATPSKDGPNSALPLSDDMLFFYGDGCPFTQRAEPAVQCLEQVSNL